MRSQNARVESRRAEDESVSVSITKSNETLERYHAPQFKKKDRAE